MKRAASFALAAILVPMLIVTSLLGTGHFATPAAEPWANPSPARPRRIFPTRRPPRKPKTKPQARKTNPKTRPNLR